MKGKLTQSQIDGFNEYFNFLHNIFIKDDCSISSSLAHRRIYVQHNQLTDILIYPSRQTNLSGWILKKV